MVTDKQVRRLFAMKNKYQYLYQAADAAGMSNKTARKYLKSGVLPSQCRAVHDWATHPDAFAQDWPWIEDYSKTTPVLNPNHFLKLFSVNIPANIRTGNSALSRDG